MKKRVYTLYRVSTIGQVEKDDIPMQKEACHEFAERQGWEIVKEFSEKGVSGFKKSAKDRDQLQLLQQAAAAGEFDVLLVFMFDRLGRRDDETPFIVEWFTKQGVEVWSVNEGQQRFDSHVDKLMNYIRYWQASGESIKTSIHTRTRIEQLTEEGHYTGGTVAFGYKRVQKGRLNKKNQAVCDLEIDEEEAAIVRLIFQKYVYEGYGVKRICNYLVENHIMGRNGKNIPTTTLVRMVRNKCYTGYLINGNVEKECPELRIIEQEVFDRAQELRDTRRREKGEDSDSYSPHALLCGKVFCAHCGNRLNITSSGRTRLRADGSTVKEKRFRYSCHYNVRHPGQCDGQSGYGVTKLDAIVESIVCTKFSEILECSKSKLLQDMLRRDMEVAQKEVSRAKSELDLKDDERNALKDEMIRVIRGKSSIDRDMIQQLLDENQAAIQAAQDALTAAQNKLEEIEQENKKAENDCSNLFTWASTYQNASFQQRQTILNQFIKEVRVGRDYDIEIILNVPLEEFEEFKSHSLSVRTPSGRKTDLKQAPVRGLGTPNGGIVVFDKTSGESMNIMLKSSAHVTLRCQDE
ncbi:MAG: recombinase family protein [Neglectibacter timonensis]